LIATTALCHVLDCSTWLFRHANVVLVNISCYILQGRILKHAGDPMAASDLADEARTMDLADRFLNSECVKRMLQADQVFVVDSDNLFIW